MASNPFNALLYDPAQLGQGIMGAFTQGREQRREMETQKALGEYAKNQNAETASGVTSHDPRLGLQLQDREAERQAIIEKRKLEVYQQQLQQRAAQGDKGALAELSGIDLNAWDKLSDNEKQQAKEQTEYVGQAALAVSQLPPEAQPAAWDQYVTYGAQRFPELAQYVGKYSPEALQGAIASANQVKTFLDMEKPSYMNVPVDADLVNVRDPAAVQQFQSMRAARDQLQVVNTPQEAANLPPGTRFVDPNGIERIVPAGGPTQPASGNFRP